jgi:hypothetical protein
VANPLAYSVDKPAFFKKVGYTPTAGQWEYHNSGARFRCAVCGRRFGKSTMAGYDRAAELLLPNKLGWIVGPTYDLGAKEFKVMWEALMIKLQLRRDKRVQGNFNIKQGDMYIEMPWGSRVEVRSAAHPDKLIGEGLDWLIVAEAAKQQQQTWEQYLRATLSDKRGSADFVTTPEGKNWVYNLWKMGRSGTRKEYASWRLPSWMNTTVFPGGIDDPEIQLVKETTIEEWFLQEYAAEFTAVVGRIFGEFAEEDHVLKETYEFNPDWPNYIAFDWGFTAPLAAVEFQVSPRDTIYVWRVHYERNRTLEWHINTLKERIQPEGYRIDGVFGDAADPEAVEYVSKHLHFCQADPDSKDWLTGIRLMKDFLKLSHDGTTYDDNEVPILAPRYYVDPDCTDHIDEMLAYKAKTGSASASQEFRGANIVASGVEDHTIDAIRYALMHLYKVGAQGHLSDIYPQWAKMKRETISVKPTRGDLALGDRDYDTFFQLTPMRSGGRF